eukprot:s444_g20.t1
MGVRACYAVLLCFASAARFPPQTSSLLLLTASAHRDDVQEHHQYSLAVDDWKGHKVPMDDVQKDYNDDSVEKKTRRTKYQENMEHALATGLAAMFLGVIFLAGFVSFILAYPDDQVRYYCVRIASSTVVIFLAISIEYAALLSTFIAKITGWTDDWKTRVLPFFFYWFLTLFVSYKVRHSHLNMVAAKSVLSHVAAFVAIYLISNVMYTFTSEIGDEEASMRRFAARFGILMGFGIVFWILRVLTMQLVYRLPYDCPFPERSSDHAEIGHARVHEGTAQEQNEHNEEGHESLDAGMKDSPHSVLHFAEEIQEAFMESSLIVLSYLATKFLAYKTILEYCGLDHKDETYVQRRKFWTISNDHVQSAVVAMAVVTIVAQFFLVVLDRRFSSLYMHHALPTFLCMCVAWSFMHFCKCLLMVPISEAHCILVSLAFLMTPAAGLLVMLADYFADAGHISDDLADVLVTSYGFMIGFSWEKAYHSSTHLLLDDYFSRGILYAKDNEDAKFIWTIAICAGAALIMLPGWRFLVLPSALKPMPPRLPLKTRKSQICGA